MLSTFQNTQNTRVLLICVAFILFQSFLFAYQATYFFSYTPWLVFALTLSWQFKRSALLVRDFVTFAVLVLMFDFLRAGIHVIHQGFNWDIHYQYVISFEKIFVSSGALAANLQKILTTPGSVSWLERFCVLIYSSHFAFFLMVAIFLWVKLPESCWRYRYALLGCCYIGLCLYFLVPTMPPWMASEKGYIPEVQNIFHNIMQVKFGELIKIVDTNPSAAMPSLHIAFPCVSLLALTHHFGLKKTWPVVIYFVMVIFTTIFLGAHYLADIFAGMVVAAFCFYVAYFKLSSSKAYSDKVSQIDLWLAASVILLFILAKVAIKVFVMLLVRH